MCANFSTREFSFALYQIQAIEPQLSLQQTLSPALQHRCVVSANFSTVGQACNSDCAQPDRRIDVAVSAICAAGRKQKRTSVN